MTRDRQLSMFWWVFATNAAVLAAAGLALALSPATVSRSIQLGQAVVLVAGVCAMLLIDLVVMRRAFGPLAALGETMERVDPLRPGARVSVDDRFAELAKVGHALNEMLGRLEVERRESARRELRAHEAERRRVAGELHDDVGQELTALMLLVDQAVERGDPAALAEAREAARDAVAKVRALARELRPDPLDELGLVPALRSLADRLERQSRTPIVAALPEALPPLDPEVELVVYRVAQESLTNALRHAPGAPVAVSLRENASGLSLHVADRGPGLPGEGFESLGTGIRGMRERALLVGATVEISTGPDGAEVRLEVPDARPAT